MIQRLDLFGPVSTEKELPIVVAKTAKHYCPAINRIESTGWNNRAGRIGSFRPEVPVKLGFSRKESH
jgi:hypothetical protein